MIVRLTGTVAEVREDRVVIDRDGIGYEVLVSGNALGGLTEQLGRQTTLHTLQYFESSGSGGNLTPRLIGFCHGEDRAFFEKFITVKNIGTRKALKALVEPVGRIAAAIESSDAKALARLPGLGRRAADQIIAELKGRVADFALGQPDTPEPAATDGWADTQRDALEVMIALGERRADGQHWLQRAIERHPGDRGADEWLRLAYRVKTGEG